jgi:hypothetical protein
MTNDQAPMTKKVISDLGQIFYESIRESKPILALLARARVLALYNLGWLSRSS